MTVAWAACTKHTLESTIRRAAFARTAETSPTMTQGLWGVEVGEWQILCCIGAQYRRLNPEYAKMIGRGGTAVHFLLNQALDEGLITRYEGPRMLWRASFQDGKYFVSGDLTEEAVGQAIGNPSDLTTGQLMHAFGESVTGFASEATTKRRFERLMMVPDVDSTETLTTDELRIMTYIDEEIGDLALARNLTLEPGDGYALAVNSPDAKSVISVEIDYVNADGKAMQLVYERAPSNPLGL